MTHAANAIPQNSIRIDESLIELNLSLSYEQRILEHESALHLALALQDAGDAYYDKFNRSSKKAP